MANPTLKAQIEAAKSALARAESAASAPAASASNQIANKLPAERTNQQVLSQEKTANPASNIRKPAGKKTFESDAVEINARITSLEEKLLASQQDLHMLLGKIRKITDLQGNTNKNRTTSESSAVDLGFRRYLNSITITFIVIICLIFGVIYFLTSTQNLLQFPLWINQLGESTSRWIG